MAEEMEDMVYEEGMEFMPEHKMMELFETMTFKEKWDRVSRGLKSPPDSGDYKFAKLQILRLTGPACAVVVPIILVMLLALLAGQVTPPPAKIEVQVKEPEPIEELEEPPEEMPDEPIEPPEPIDFEQANEMVTVDTPIVVNAPSTSSDFSPQPAPMDSVAITKSPVVMKGIFGSRSPGSRGQALGTYGGSGVTEGAVMRALRWLKKNQTSDGYFAAAGGHGGNAPNTATAAMGLLTFLAHGETPASPEFGSVVEKAIRFVSDAQKSDGHFNYSDGHEYTLPIAVYALAEAYSVTKIPMLKDNVAKGLEVIMKGQNASGGWNYNCKPCERDDTSYMGWCVQALKAAKMSGAVDEEEIKKTMKQAIKGFEKNQGSYGAFGYTGPAKSHGLTGAGVLCLQFMGEGKSKAVRQGVEYLKGNATFNWAEKSGGQDKIYYWYYITQAMFHTGGETWDTWNKKFSLELVRQQTVLKKDASGYVDHLGKPQDIGWWEAPGNVGHHTGGLVMDVCFCALQLQVYYRYLPTFKTPKPVEAENIAEADEDDIQIDIQI